MKKYIITLVLGITFFISIGQVQPEWTQTVNALPDSAYMFPVRTLTDGSNNIYVLSSYQSNSGVNDYKVYLNKYGYTGQLLWTTIFDNAGSGLPRGFDMAVDGSGNCYIAGGFMTSPNKPLLMKVNTSGTVVWVNDSTTALNNNIYSQVFFVNNKLQVASFNGIALFDLNGNEIWSRNIQVSRLAVDYNGQFIISGYQNGDNIFRYDSLGILNFSDSTIDARRITVDQNNNMILLADAPVYTLVKYDSGGTFAWSKDSFPPAPGFGDIGFEVLTDSYNDIVVVGLNDTMFKFAGDGMLKWVRPMHGLDNYLLSAKIVSSDLILITGAITDSVHYNVGVSLFNLYGIENWSGTYNSNNVQEFPVDVTLDNMGIYVLEDSISRTSLLKFQYQATGLPQLDFTLICVDSVWYDPANPNMVDVSIFNGNIDHLNYPSVMIISPNGDTISNRYNLVNFFAHLGNRFQTYSDTILVAGITDFSGYSFVMSDGFGDTSVVIQMCSTLSVDDLESNGITVFPNPVSDNLFIRSNFPLGNLTAEIYDQSGRLLIRQRVVAGESINVEALSSGVYVMKLIAGNELRFVRIVRQ